MVQHGTDGTRCKEIITASVVNALEWLGALAVHVLKLDVASNVSSLQHVHSKTLLLAINHNTTMIAKYGIISRERAH